MRIAIGSDHAGFELKESLRGFIGDLRHDAMDLGTDSTEPVDYPDFAQAVGLAVQAGQAGRNSMCPNRRQPSSICCKYSPAVIDATYSYSRLHRCSGR